MSRRVLEVVREGRYAAKVQVDLVDGDGGWAPYLSMEDSLKLDRVRLALRQGRLARAARDSRVFELKPVSSEFMPRPGDGPGSPLRFGRDD